MTTFQLRQFDPAVHNAIRERLKDGSISSLGVALLRNYDPLRACLAMLRIGYLAMFNKIGYGYILSPAARVVRELIADFEHVPVEVHHIALEINQIYSCAGKLRDDVVGISGGKHVPPDHGEVQALVAGMCDYVNNHWDAPAIHLASYLMWRVNWIHPFFGGNGRTARALAYLVLCARLGFILPGVKTIPEMIVADRDPYYEALRKADDAWKAGTLDVGLMESLMSSLLAKQLADVPRQATGKSDPADWGHRLG